jgi:hypothetical protein
MMGYLVIKIPQELFGGVFLFHPCPAITKGFAKPLFINSAYIIFK